MPLPEQLARQQIDARLVACGWIVQDRSALNLYAGRGVAVREFPLETGFADYLLFADRMAVGVIEAKAEGTTLTGVADQAAEYTVGLPPTIPHIQLPLPFFYESTGVETLFRGNRDPEPRSRLVFSFHRPETLVGWAHVRLEAIAEVRLGRQRSPARALGPNMRPYMRAANVTWNGMDLADMKDMDFSPGEQVTYRLRDGDILLSEASGSISEVGKPAIWRNQIEECYFQNTLIRVRSHGPSLEYLYIHFLYDALAERFRAIAKGVGINHLGAENLSGWLDSLPPLAEQLRIVVEVERRLSVVRQMMAAVAANLKRAERLRQAVLKRALEGKFVPQDPNDEPAEALLTQMRETQATPRSIEQGRRRKQHSTPVQRSLF